MGKTKEKKLKVLLIYYKLYDIILKLRHSRAVAVGILFFVWLVFAHPYFLKNLVPFPSDYLVDFFPPWNNLYALPVKNNAMPDIITQIYPWKKLVIESWKRKILPMWNPYQFSGTLLLANYQSAAFSPFNILFFILPFIDAWSVMILLQPLMAGIFMYIYAETIGLGKRAAFVSSVSFMFCGFITVWMAYGTLAYALLFLPLALYGVEQYIISKKVKFGGVITIALTLSLLSGHFQTSLYVYITTILYIVYRSIQIRKINILIQLMFYTLLGIIFSYPQLSASIELYKQSVRSSLHQVGSLISPVYLITMFAPDFFGNPVTRNDWFGNYAEWASFTGSVTLLLSSFSLFSKKKPYVYFFIFLALISLLLSSVNLLAHFVVILKLPVLSTSAFSRIIALFSFSISILGGIGYDVLFSSNIKRQIRKIIAVAVFFFIIISLLWISAYFKKALFLKTLTSEQSIIALRNLFLPSLLTSIVLVFIIAMILSKTNRKLRNIFSPYVFSLLVLFLIIFEMLRYSLKWMPYGKREYVYPELPVIAYLKEHAGYTRVFGNIGNEVFSSFHLYGIEGYDPLYIKRYGEFIRFASNGKFYPAERSVVRFDKNGVFAKKLLDFLGVRYLFHSKGDGRNSWAFPFWEYPESFGSAVYSDDYYEIYENTHAYPRAYIVYSYTVKTENKEILSYIYSNETNLLDEVVLEENIQELYKKDETCTGYKEASIVFYTPDKIKILVNSNCNGILILTDVYYPAWKAKVNGKKVKIYRADYTFRAVIVPKGSSVVEFYL